MADALPPLLPFWSDDWEGDLLKLVPGVREALGDAEGVTLYTYDGSLTHGRINLPCVWNTDHGLTAYFGVRRGYAFKPPHAFTTEACVECTWLEVLRDVWSHDYCVVVDGRVVLAADAFYAVFYPMLEEARGWKKLDDDARQKLQRAALALIQAATDAFRRVLARRDGAG